ncbi:TPA: hypothetical protein ACGW5B_002875 [Bacillus paranthracis]|uniref:Uncharacterized protein n=1 Tax=Bacillus pretiosus TaxID=2983392 RepID=A0ABT3EX37_9BACI|nr:MULTISPECIES: hypothetical protein [Bacillus]MDA1585803.1 hypothetical protein [Bacillus cereus group sp. TH230-1LC]PEB07825.1 hypothetical protein COM56_06600 [Bacillus cereus]MBG9905443.1 hypothetical protein [Bacillus paranthracis]MCW1241322.1 hypothetical protein [Bacillus pretiosus]MCZ7522511.1 hypothetical protein [Bacillus pacificus]
MNDVDIQQILDELWGATILDTQLDILKDNMKFILQIIDDGAIKEIKLEFIDVSAFYYVKDDENLRFEFYNREKVEFLELTTIYYQDSNMSKVKLDLLDEEEWGSKYSTGINIVMEIWDSVLLVEARQISLNEQLINLKM